MVELVTHGAVSHGTAAGETQGAMRATEASSAAEVRSRSLARDVDPGRLELCRSAWPSSRSLSDILLNLATILQEDRTRAPAARSHRTRQQVGNRRSLLYSRSIQTRRCPCERST